MESPWQNIIPDSLLLDIFSYLDIKTLGRSAQVCTTWRRVAYDEFLWHNIIKRVWKVTGGLAPGKSSWYEEVRRLTDHVPTECCETLEKHTDEVLDVSISHNGEYFCTCSKEALIIMWKLGKETELVKSIDTNLLLKWELSQYSAFSPDDALILVCGVQRFDAPQDDWVHWARWGYGVVAVLTVPDLNIVCVAEMATLFGAWLNESVFLTSLPQEQSDKNDIQAYKVRDCDVLNCYLTPDSNKHNNPDLEYSIFADIPYTRKAIRLFTFQENRHHLMNMLVANVPVINIDSTLSCDQSRSGDSSRSCDSAETQENEFMATESINRTGIVEGALSLNVNRTCDIHNSENVSTVLPEYSRTDITDKSELLCQNVKQYVIFTAGEHTVIGIHEISSESCSKFLDEHCNQGRKEDLHGDDIDKIDHSVTLKDCYITGLCLSHDQRYLYFNFREMDKNTPENKVDNPEDELPVSEKVFDKELKIGCIDLVTLERVKDHEFTGHVAFSAYPAWYICLDASPDFIGSGSEDLRGYLWDRHYGVPIGRLFHSVSDTGNNTLYVMSLYDSTVVNGIVFSPVDQETCVTVCDDGLIKIWRSKHKIRTALSARKAHARRELATKISELIDNLWS
ncbi:F-box/WD repeat-containing protein 5-like [Ruditapes philippinarum]|uniref:F-box/WD repeat-containing protein 5-like n=1 Tax=Ruditapes philippinarum TaxID=129788 RepID=UPI00295C27FF|nr:F-box/WD repeat-containing protein 5-like [Ruditapes philippinarum]